MTGDAPADGFRHRSLACDAVPGVHGGSTATGSTTGLSMSEHVARPQGAAFPEPPQLVVFDLDGTLYQGDGFLPTYLELLALATGASAAGLLEEVEAILAGRHAVPMGAVLDPQDGSLLIAPAGVVIEVHTWEGRRRRDDPRLGAPLGPLAGRTYLGDPWQVVLALARHLDLDAQGVEDAFAEVRNAINADPGALVDTTDLATVLDATSTIAHRYVMTNTPEHLARPLVERLGIDRWAHGVRYRARKPDGLLRWLPELLETHDVEPTDAVCVGDNLLNDVHPALELGVAAVWIDPYQALQQEGAAHRVRSLAEVPALLGCTGHSLRG